jgi:K+ transporter
LPFIIAGSIYAIWSPSLDESRDIVVIVYGIVGATFFFAAIVITTAVGIAIFGMINKTRSILDDSVVPALSSVKDAADTLRGTTEFVGRNAVAPVVKAYSTLAAIKKAFSVLSGLKSREKSK